MAKPLWKGPIRGSYILSSHQRLFGSVLRRFYYDTERLIAEEVVSLGDVRLATADGEAMVWVDGLDLSGYAGALGNTDYFVRLTGSGGKVASAYCAGAGEGLTLGSELVTNGDFTTNTTGWSANNAALLSSVPGGLSGNCLQVQENGVENPWAQNVVVVSPGCLYCQSASYKEGTSNSFRLYTIDTNRWGTVPTSSTRTAGSDWTNETKYNTAFGTEGDVNWVLRAMVGAGSGLTMLFDSISFKKVTDVPATGLHLVSALDGSTRNMASVGSGFNPNNINKIEIFRVK